ncbi:MAG: 16S rRNA (cytosine(967)-C(5))-methyltransferase RsmB [Gammaproteobacteria bacterium]|nr:16S rRNA (cytosine(967)-C(5))-methyltransferase RsmB [Gammaproteobacteria bacterium]
MISPEKNSFTDNPRILALKVLLAVIEHRHSLDQTLKENTKTVVAENNRSLIKALSYGVLRHYFHLQALTKLLLKHPVKAKDQDLLLLIMMGLFQLQHHRVPEYAVVSETVNTAVMLGKSWAKGLLNAVLRGYQRQREQLAGVALLQSDSARYNAADWIIKLLRQDWPQHWQALLQANSQQAPMVIRVNHAQIGRDAYLAQLAEAGLSAVAVSEQPMAVRLINACDVKELPGFEQGWFSIQDAAAQWAAPLLEIEKGQRVLDACAAPGGKTTHMLECQPELAQLVAVEIDAARVAKITDNLQRLGYANAPVELSIADAVELASWWDGRPFQRILLDAPCSASGVIRRHPDIQLLRRPTDIDALVDRQARLLRSLWKTLAPGGIMIYCTCSVFKAENEQQILAFLTETIDAEASGVTIPQSVECKVGTQILTGSLERDGFYYAKLVKRG